MKIVLVHGKYFNSWEALGLGYIGAYIKKMLPLTNISFYQGSFDREEDIIEDAVDADIVFFSCTSPSFKYCVEMARRIKKENGNVHMVLGGYHPSSLPEDSLVEGIDQVVVGEGEGAAVDIINGNRDKILIGRRMKFSELDWPDRELIKNERNIGVAYKDTGTKITSFQSARACPFSCKYCADGYCGVLYGGRTAKVERRGIDDLLSEMIFVKEKYGLDFIKFSDPTWNTNLQYIKDFCKEKIRRGLETPFYPNIHAKVVDDEMFDLMAKANCTEIGLGVESGSEKILSQIGKTTNRGHVKNAVELAHKYGIKVRGYFIIGMPDEDEDDLLLTEEFADELDLDEYGFTILCPYPGTKMYYDDPDKFKDIDWANTDEYINDFWETNHLSNKRLREWQTRLTKKFNEKLTWHNKVLLGGQDE